MPFALLIVGAVLLVSAVRNTSGDLYTLVKGDFTGTNNYMYWMVSILVIGALGYIDSLKPLSRVFLVLVVVVLFLKTGNPNGTGGGFFAQFNKQIFQTTNSTGAETTTPTT